MNVVFTAAADEELESAIAWYERERPGLGRELFAEVARSIAVIGFYRVHGDTVTVEGFLHGSRDPFTWVARDS